MRRKQANPAKQMIQQRPRFAFIRIDLLRRQSAWSPDYRYCFYDYYYRYIYTNCEEAQFKNTTVIIIIVTDYDANEERRTKKKRKETQTPWVASQIKILLIQNALTRFESNEKKNIVNKHRALTLRYFSYFLLTSFLLT